jgi:membrane carboxypeptidase/penicillin-binding protein PbpC
MIRRMLTRPLPDFSGGGHLAWKTGTSNGNHDAWCFAFSANYTVGVWFGNKDGKASAALVGQSAAAPAAGRVMEEIGRFADHGILPDFPDTFRFDRLCSDSGLRAGADCKKTFQSYSLKHAQLRPCRRCGGKQFSKVMILNPKPENYLARENERLSLTLTADGTTPLHWFLNRKYLGRFRQKSIPFTPGVYRLQAISENPDTDSGTVTFRVSEMPQQR